MPGPDDMLPEEFPPDDVPFREMKKRYDPSKVSKVEVDPKLIRQLEDLAGRPGIHRPSTGAFGIWQETPAPEFRGYGHEEPMPSTRELLAHHVGQILDHLGYDRVNGQHFKDTPRRVAEVLLHYAKNGDEALLKSILGVQFVEPDAVSSLVLEGPVRYTSRCAHHLEPVDGWAWVGYLPEQNVCGLSKMARVVSFFAAQLTVQELVTQQIADALLTHLKPKGVMVVIRAEHGCMRRRGVMEPCALTTTSAVRGVFKDSPTARNEFLLLMKEPQA